MQRTEMKIHQSEKGLEQPCQLEEAHQLKKTQRRHKQVKEDTNKSERSQLAIRQEIQRRAERTETKKMGWVPEIDRHGEWLSFFS